jgi:hypothetical protein
MIVSLYSWFSFLACKPLLLNRVNTFIHVLSGCTIFFHITLKRHDFMKNILKIKYLFDYLYNVC